MTNQDILNQLGVMQFETLKLIHAGKFNREIATELDRSSKSVEAYVGTVFDTLNVRNRVEAALFYERYLMGSDEC